MQKKSCEIDSPIISCYEFEPNMVPRSSNPTSAKPEEMGRDADRAEAGPPERSDGDLLDSLEQIYKLARKRMPDQNAEEVQIEVYIRLAESTRVRRLLYKLAGHADPRVRSAVTENKQVPSHLVVRLSCDEHVDVRYSVADNPGSPMLALVSLLEDENPYVAHRAGQTLMKMSRSDTVSANALPLSQTWRRPA